MHFHNNANNNNDDNNIQGSDQESDSSYIVYTVTYPCLNLSLLYWYDTDTFDRRFLNDCITSCNKLAMTMI